MIDFNLNYRASVFTDTIEATSDNISKLLNTFSYKGLLPNVFQEPLVTAGEIQIIGGLNPTVMSPVLELKSSNGKFLIRFARGRIDIITTKISLTDDIGDRKQFFSESEDCFKKINNLFNSNFNRIAFASSSLLKKMDDNELNNVYMKMLNPIDFYRINIPPEWNLRQVGKYPIQLKERNEIINVISNVSRMEVKIDANSMVTKSDRMILDFDINTDPRNLDKRFTIEEYCIFSDRILSIQDQIIDQYNKLIL